MEPGGPDEAQGADALLSLAALAEEADSPDTQSADEGDCCALLEAHQLTAQAANHCTVYAMACQLGMCPACCHAVEEHSCGMLCKVPALRMVTATT